MCSMRDFILDKSHYTLPNYRQKSTRTPYPFQQDAFNALDKLKKNNPDGYASMLVLPTGAGKTYTAAHWIIKNYLNQGVKVLWIAHRSELLRQAAEAFFNDTTPDTLPDRDKFISYVVSSEFGKCFHVNTQPETPDLLIASRQSLCSGTNLDFALKWAKGRGLKANRKLLIVLDEAHHAAAASYRTIIDKMKKFIPHVDILGLTATPYRTAKSEQGSLKKIFSTGNGIVFSIDMNTLISAGILSNPKHIEVSTNVDMTGLFDPEEMRKIARNDLTSLDEKSLRKLNENTERNRLIVDTYLAQRKEFGQTIVFAVDVLNAVALNAIFQSAGVKSDFVVSSIMVGMNRSVATERNPQVIRAFKEGKLEVLINVNIVTEGTDIPNIQTVFLARPTTSKILMTQMIGRGLRGEAAGGTKETNIVYFVDDWKGLVDFVSPKALLDGEDQMADRTTDKRKMLNRYIQLAEVEQFSVNAYQSKPKFFANFNNIIPCGIIKCSYLSTDEYGDETELSRDIVVFDEALEIYKKILDAIPVCVSSLPEEYTQHQVRALCSELFFKFCEEDSGTYIGISSETIYYMVQSYLATQEIPAFCGIADRISLMEIVKANYTDDMTQAQIEEVIQTVWANNSKVRLWYDKELYYGMMRVYFNRMAPAKQKGPEFILPPKEKMDMWEIRKHYPEYYEELRTYLILNMKRDEEGYYYSAIQEEGQPPIRSKYLHMFEMDHIKPISKGGLTVKNNLQMITRKQNREKGDKL